MPSYKTLAVNDVGARNVYGSASGVSLGVRSTALTPYSVDSQMGVTSANTSGAGPAASTTDTAQSAAATSAGFMGQPVTWWLVLVAMLFGVMFVAKRLGEGDEFRNVRLSAYNIIVISLAAIVGIGFFKVVVNRWRVPGLTEFVNAV